MNDFFQTIINSALGPFAEGFATQLVVQTKPQAKELGKDAVAEVKKLLLGTATTADDTLVLENLEGFLEGALEEIRA